MILQIVSRNPRDDEKSNVRGGNTRLETEIFLDNRTSNGASICCGKRGRIVPDVNGGFVSISTPFVAIFRNM